jgi:hypothetical protein
MSFGPAVSTQKVPLVIPGSNNVLALGQNFHDQCANLAGICAFPKSAETWQVRIPFALHYSIGHPDLSADHRSLSCNSLLCPTTSVIYTRKLFSSSPLCEGCRRAILSWPSSYQMRMESLDLGQDCAEIQAWARR